ncbi:40S ribosomal protein S2-like [Chelonia mydas]|uniref:40S ribosomal protein S2-like n=1 Tax=Chelonia mydas TaxID=8469 RepID=UPI001CAA0FDD|nr:40S ribosomal protein S2-like [Chelonia mydas]
MGTAVEMDVEMEFLAGGLGKCKAIGDYNGHVGLGVKCSKEVATAIRGAIILAKPSIVPVRRGYWGNKIGKPHSVSCKVTGRCGSVLVHLIPAPHGTRIVSAPVPKKLLMVAGIDDCYASARGCTATLGNFAKATFEALSKTYSYLTPDLWKETVFTKSPYQEFTDHLAKTHTRVSVQRTQAAAVANQKSVVFGDECACVVDMGLSCCRAIVSQGSSKIPQVPGGDCKLCLMEVGRSSQIPWLKHSSTETSVIPGVGDDRVVRGERVN